MKILKAALLSTLACLLFSTSAHSKTWLLAAAACPPWKAIPDKPKLTAKMAGACGKDVELIVAGFKAAFGINDDTIITLTDKEATSAGVTAAIKRLTQEAGPDDRVVLYVNTHGGKIEAMYKGYEVKDEIFAWYTKDKPEDMTRATADGDWMSTRAFRDLVNKIQANEIITIIEACHADASLADYINNVSDGIGGRGTDWPGREAVIFSAYDEQIANFTPDGARALFTKNLSEVMQQGNHDTFFDIFEQARLATHRQARAACMKGHTHKDLVEDWKTYRSMCTQMPNAWDPFGLLEDIPTNALAYGYK